MTAAGKHDKMLCALCILRLSNLSDVQNDWHCRLRCLLNSLDPFSSESSALFFHFSITCAQCWGLLSRVVCNFHVNLTCISTQRQIKFSSTSVTSCCQLTSLIWLESSVASCRSGDWINYSHVNATKSRWTTFKHARLLHVIDLIIQR